MNTVALTLALVLVGQAQALPQASAPAAAQATPGSGEAALPEPWRGTPEEAVRELRRLSLDGDHPEALALAGRALLASREPENSWSEARRAALDYGVGLTLLLAGEDLHLDVRGDAEAAFDSAAALAGPGDLRLDALYNAALVHLQFAELRRGEIPEVLAAEAAGATGGAAGGAPGAALPPGAMPPGVGDAEEAPDPLDLARAAYLAARAGFVRRLRAEWGDADTAANLELIERRLEELDEIERQREEQEQEQQQGEDQAPSEDGEQQENEQQEEQQQDDQQQDDQQQDESGQDEQQEQPEQPEEPPPGEDQAEEQPEQDESESPPPEDEQSGELEPPAEQPEPTPAPAAEQHLTREEVVRLLDRLAELEEDARELGRAIQRQRRIPVERDW